MDSNNFYLDDIDEIRMIEWWKKRRLRYNLALIISCAISLILYVLVIVTRTDFQINILFPEEYEFTYSSLMFQGVQYIVVLILGNLCYSLGLAIDRKFNKSHSDRFRRALFSVGLWFSCLVPLIFPLLAFLNHEYI
jgi:hypothetical protein